MRLRVYVDGKPDWSPNFPGGFGRVSGYGGSTLGHAMTPMRPLPGHQPSPDTAARNANRPRCGVLLAFGIGCARNLGHKDKCRPAELMQADNARHKP
jgi:hypothetical protein